jgi:RNA polymerase-associated protein RTF1
MPEIEREEVLAQRLEVLQRTKDKRNLDQMLKAQKAGDGDSIAKAAKREFAMAFLSNNSNAFSRPAHHSRRD